MTIIPRYLLAGLAVFLTACSAGQMDTGAVRGVHSSEVDALFSQYGKDTPGCAVAVDHLGKFVHMDGYGMADLETGTPITPQSVFYTASVSKQVVAMAALLLESEGTIDLDAPVRMYLPSLPAYADQITARQLLHHTSGIRDYFVLFRLAGRFDGEVITEDKIMDILALQRGLNFEPGARYAYSNSAYFLISQIVSMAKGENLNAYAQAHIFTPLGMKDTLFQHDHLNPITGKAQGYKPNPDGSYRRANAMLDVVGSGGMYSTVYDLILWQRNFLNNELGGGQYLVADMRTSATLNDGTRTDYGLGIRSTQYRGLTRQSHNGSLQGYRATLQHYIYKNFTVAVLCNSSASNPTKLANQITDIYLKGDLGPKAQPNSKNNLEDTAPQFALTQTELASYAGRYYSGEVDNTLILEIADKGLRITGMDGLEDNFLTPTGTDTFYHLKNKFTLVFEHGQTTVTAFTFNAPRVSGIRFEKQ